MTLHHKRRVKRENQQDATNPMFIIKLLYQRVSGIIMPIIRRTRPCTAAYGVLHCNKRGKNPQDARAVVSLCGVMSSEHSWDFVCMCVCVYVYVYAATGITWGS